MQVMGLSDLAIIAPKPGIFPSEEATARAVSAEVVLDQATVHECLEDALADCHGVVGTTARQRHIGPPVLAPRQWCEQARERRGEQLALVFGQERTGLTNEEVDQCHALIRIPTQEDFASLNLAMAVQLLCYDWHLSQAQPAPTIEPTDPRIRPATHAELDGFLAHLRRVSDAVDFFTSKNPDSIHRRLRALFSRSGLDNNEINILRGFLRDIEKKLPENPVE